MRVEAPFIYNGDYNGTLGPVGRPPIHATVQTFNRWRAAGNIIDFNSSDNFPQGNVKFGDLVNGTRVTELGVGGYDFEGKLVIFNSFSQAELVKIGDVCADQKNIVFRSAAFLPRFDKTSSHGVYMFIDKGESDEQVRSLTSRYPQFELLRDIETFLRYLNQFKGDIGMVTFQVSDQNREGLIRSLDPMQVLQDTSGSIYATPEGVDKAKTLLGMLDLVYKRKPDGTIIVGGDSPDTDGSLFKIPEVTKIAVGDSRLVQKGVSGRVHVVKSPEGARRVLENKLRTLKLQ